MIREAGINDIPAMHSIRMSVKENVLSNPLKVTENDYRDYLLEKGKGWIYESGNEIRGFAIIDLSAQNIWALFVKPAFEKMGIGRKLHDTMLDWYFNNYHQKIWLGTSAGTRAEAFYRKAGWKERGTDANGEIIFEMTSNDWKIHPSPTKP